VVLEHVKDRLRPGSFLYFDQFHHRCDQLWAFAELVDENPELRFELVAASRDLSKVAFRRLGDDRASVVSLTPSFAGSPIDRRLRVPSSRVSLLASCVSSSGLGCGHWSEFIYACKRAWPEVLAGLVLAAFIGVTGRGHPQRLHLAVGIGVAVIVGFIAYYVSL